MTGIATYQCLKCRLAQRAEVRTSKAHTTARRGAHRADANTAMAKILALKKCPRCGHYDRGVAEHNRHTVRVGTIAWAVLLASIALSLLAIPAVSHDVFVATSGGLVLALVALFLRLRHRYPANVESRVRFVGTAPVNDGWF